MNSFDFKILEYLINAGKRSVLDLRPLLEEINETEKMPLRKLSAMVEQMKKKGLISVVNYSTSLASKKGPIKAKIERKGIQKYNSLLDENK